LGFGVDSFLVGCILIEMKVFLLGVYLSIFVFLTSCRDNEIKVYQIAKDVESDSLVDSGAEVSASFLSSSEISEIKLTQTSLGIGVEEMESWSVPNHWEILQASTMVRNKFKAGECVVSLSVFPGIVGGDLANVNRWRVQCGLDAITESVMESLVSNEFYGERQYKYLMVQGSDKSLDSAWLFDGDKTYFIKLAGSSTEVENERDAFKAFLSSIVWK